MTVRKKESNYHFSYTIGIEKTQDDVWNLLCDVSQWKAWDTELEEAIIVGEFKKGATGILVPKSGPKLNFSITDVEEYCTYEFKTKMPVGYIVIKRKLEFKDGRTYFTDDIRFTGLLKNVFGFILGRGFRSVLPKVMQNFKELCEKKKS